MDRDKAKDVVWACLVELQRNMQSGEVHIVTGRGTHSHNRKANLRPLIIESLNLLGLEYSLPDNAGVIVVHVRP